MLKINEDILQHMVENVKKAIKTGENVENEYGLVDIDYTGQYFCTHKGKVTLYTRPKKDYWTLDIAPNLGHELKELVIPSFIDAVRVNPITFIEKLELGRGTKTLALMGNCEVDTIYYNISRGPKEPLTIAGVGEIKNLKYNGLKTVETQVNLEFVTVDNLTTTGDFQLNLHGVNHIKNMQLGGKTTIALDQAKLVSGKISHGDYPLRIGFSGIDLGESNIRQIEGKELVIWNPPMGFDFGKLNERSVQITRP